MSNGIPLKKISFSGTLLLLAWPAIVENFLQSMVGFVDSLFISKLGLTEVATVGVTNAILQIYFAIFMSVSTAAAVFISRSIGEQDTEKTKVIISHALMLTIGIGFLFGFVSLFFAPDLLSLMGANAEVVERGSTYFRVIATPSIFMSLVFTIGSILRGTGDTKTPLRAGLWMNFIHIILDYILIFGLFFEGFGLTGAAIATVLARIIGVALLFRGMKRKNLLPPLSPRFWSIRPDLLYRMSRLGTPAMLERLFMRTGQILYFGMIIRMGTDIYAAHTLTGNFTLFSTIVGTGLGVATTTLIGQSIGSGKFEDVKRYGKIATGVTSTVMTVVLLIVWLYSFGAATWFTTSSEVIHLITTVLLIDLFAQPATGLVTSLTAILQAGGDTKFPMYVTWFGIWAIRTLGVYLLGVYLGWGLIGAWCAIAFDNYIRAGILYWRYRSFKWLKVI
ncbi:MATE family efflux transporter [Paenibacillus chondroitinus]|uniref:Probable multidrug resistance protein NorM n=1 Tax=Paenibacillus chondroitinus TaxID=59842 RepID=A0ABU6DM81_9BACL|nr:MULTISPECIES: MATE family efflux transporter [Paenibacillus]MCY9661977.1 MATE family efflux transporter [Paenibacillus anseongense]MEB4798899.1 MATE family efflux transporter [Paenibacillus chondroitinus]